MLNGPAFFAESSDEHGTERPVSPRERRLLSDAQQVHAAFLGHPFIRVMPVGPPPTERYRVIYDCPGLWLDATTNQTRVRGQHVVDIYLPPEYPREKPYCTSPNPVFHPNFANYVCIADYWSPGQALVDVIIQIGDMLQYKLYNTDSPLNAIAARWVLLNLDKVPLGDLTMLPSEPEIRLH